ncbi:protein DA1-like isoform X2 [Rhododendron vialii]|uniref:protein DA1-like isoform X2 n=1 Tax=Rhododendron vialii TaxID=182163 RepID=UPI00265E15E1|nr:protein DA1-like isoform X2 [Rhododendron vialii]
MMGWLNKIFKGSRPKVSERQHHRNGRQGEQTVGGSSHKEPERQHHRNGRQGEQTVGNEPLTSRDEWSEIEDIDHAIALSLSEDDHKRRTVIDNESQLKEDEQLAKAIQDSWNVASPTRYGNGNLHRSIPSPYSTGFRICAGCNTEIGYGRPLNCMGAFWHPECFRCRACNEPIRDLEIPTNAAGLIEYKSHPFWVQKYCPSHERDGTPRCCSCERLEPRDTQYPALDDGRKLCLECLDSAIMDTNECQPLYLDIQVFYEGLNMRVEQQVPLLLVERQALNVAMDGEKRGHHHMPETRGLCLSEEQTVSTILRRGGKRAMGMRTEPYKLTRRCEVTAILILYGLPRLLTGSILAHEMMHAWLRIKGYRTLNQDVEEGICQVLAHMWLDSQILSMSGSNAASTSSSSSLDGSRSPLERKLGDFFKHQIESDTSLVYGNGYRAGKQAILKYGLTNTLEHIRLTGFFPC